MTSPITLTAPAAFEQTAAGTLPKRVRGTAYSGGRVPDRNLVIDLSTTTVITPAPLLANHRGDQTIGRVERAEVAGSIVIEGDLYSDIDPGAEMIARKAQRGHPWQMSIGVFDYASDYVPPGSRVTVNGREFDGPIEVARHGKVRETSIVSLGADYDTTSTFFQHNDRSLPMADANAAGLLLATMTGERDTARARVAELEASTAAAAARITELQTELDALRASAQAAERDKRTADVRAFFVDVGMDYSDEAAAAYLPMDAATFATVRAQMTASIKPRLPAHLQRSLADEAATQVAPGGLLMATVRAAHNIK